MGSVASASVVVPRRARPRLTISPRARARLLAGFLAVNLIIVMLPAANVQRLELAVPTALIKQLEADTDTSLANTYSAVVWGVVAVLAVAQLLRPPSSSRRRWLWRLGWLSVALLAALIALEERASLKDAIGTLTLPVDLSLMPNLEAMPGHTRWLAVLALPLAAPLAAAGWVLLTSQRLHPARALLTLLAIVFVACAIVLDSDVLHIAPISWSVFLEEGLELTAAAILVVILIEMLAARPGTVPDTLGRRRRGPGRRAAALAATAVLLAASAFPLLSTQHVFEDNRWGGGGGGVSRGPTRDPSHWSSSGSARPTTTSSASTSGPKSTAARRPKSSPASHPKARTARSARAARRSVPPASATRRSPLSSSRSPTAAGRSTPWPWAS